MFSACQELGEPIGQVALRITIQILQKEKKNKKVITVYKYKISSSFIHFIIKPEQHQARCRGYMRRN